jgi:2-desacetyl-2-hydroxyethyl bacteriochlorophyllide A dehydrogenase
MKAAIYTGNETFALQERSPPHMGPADVRIDVGYVGICGTDMHVYKGHMDKRVGFDRVIGHEMSGTVSEVGPEVQDIAVGDKVVVRPLVSCGKCPACLVGNEHICHKLNFIGLDSDGAFREQMVAPGALLHKVPESMDLLHAALVEPTAVACHAIKRSRLRAGEDVLILGAGPIGMLIAMVARHAGGNVTISETNTNRLELAGRLGFGTVDPTESDVGEFIHSKTSGKGAEVVFEVSGSQAAVRAMTTAAASRGRVVMIAIHAQRGDIDLFQFFWRELEMIGGRVYQPDDFDKAIALLASHEIPAASLITEVSELESIGATFRSLGSNPSSMKSIIRLG